MAPTIRPRGGNSECPIAHTRPPSLIQTRTKSKVTGNEVKRLDWKERQWKGWQGKRDREREMEREREGEVAREKGEGGGREGTGVREEEGEEGKEGVREEGGATWLGWLDWLG